MEEAGNKCPGEDFVRALHTAIGVSIPPITGVADEIWMELMEGNQRFTDGRLSPHQLRTEREFLVSGQHPKAVVIGCADSRVPPEMIFDQSLGDLFVIRTAGNVVDAIALGSVEYAVEHLGVRLVIVLGHDRCGAVQAACGAGEIASPNLKAIIAELKPSVAECVRLSGTPLVREVVERNALRVADNLVYRSAVLTHAVAVGELQIVPARYDLFSGEVSRVADREPEPLPHTA